MHAPRKIETVVEERVSLSEHASVLKFQDDKIVGYAEAAVQYYKMEDTR